MKRILYFSGLNPEGNSAAGVRAKFFIADLSNEFKIKNLSAEKGLSHLTFTLASNQERLLIRLLKEVIVAFELSLRILTTKCDLIILSSPPYFTNLIAAIILRVFRKKYIFDIRDLYPEVFFHMNLLKRDTITGRFLLWITKIALDGATTSITVTEGLVKAIQSNYHIEPVLIYNGYDANHFYEIQKDDEFKVLFHGNLGKMQNIDLLVSVAKELHDIEFIVAGKGPQEHKLANLPNLSFLGEVLNSEIPKIVKSSHLGLSFRNDGIINETSFPVKIFEYLGAKLPVISTPHSEAGFFLEKNKLGFQYKNSERNQIVNKIREIQKNSNTNNVDLTKYSRQYQSKKFTDVVREVLN